MNLISLRAHDSLPRGHWDSGGSERSRHLQAFSASLRQSQQSVGLLGKVLIQWPSLANTLPLYEALPSFTALFSLLKRYLFIHGSWGGCTVSTINIDGFHMLMGHRLRLFNAIHDTFNTNVNIGCPWSGPCSA